MKESLRKFSIIDGLEKIYFQSQSARFEALKKSFHLKFGSQVEMIARAPGRVNLIGEHIDYSGFSVMPIAIEYDFIMGFERVPHSSMLEIFNTNAAYEDFSVDISCLDLSKVPHCWAKYFLCGLQGILDFISKANIQNSACGIRVVIDGKIPAGAGLSSSSAFVCCAAMVAMKAFRLDIGKIEMAEICCQCEKYIGTEGGGMDQAISLLAEKNCAKRIDFFPLTSLNASLPTETCFVIADSLVESHKAITSGVYYNVRVVECRIGAQMIAKFSGLDWRAIRTLRNVKEKLGKNFQEMQIYLKEILHDGEYSLQEVLAALECDFSEFSTLCLSSSTQHLTSFKVKNRCLHVYSESERVFDFYSTCHQENLSWIQRCENLGNFMNQSHESCKNLYECSCDELDTLVKIARMNGAFGARMTGAGWGGCVVSFIAEKNLASFLKQLEASYYQPFAHKRNIPLDMKKFVFVSPPSSGACFISP